MKSIIKLIYLLLIGCTYVNSQYFPIDTGGSCQKYIGDSPTLQLCDGFLSNPDSIYINSTSTQQEIRDQGNLIRLYISVRTVESCKNSTSTYTLLCSFLFPECSEYTDPVTQKKIAYPIFPCNENCVNMTNNCQISTKLNCAMKYSSNGVSFPVFPKNSTVYKNPSDNTSFTDTCQDTSKIEYSPNIQKCFAPLVYHVTTDQAYDESIGYVFPTTNASCVVQCPAPLYYKYQWKNLYRLSDSLSIISCILTLFLVLTLGVINPKISRFDKINLALLSSIFLQSFSGALMAFHGTEKTLCPSEGRFASHIDNVCVSSAFILHGASLLVVQWWCIMSFEIWITIFQVGKKQSDRFIYYIIATMIIAWVPPIVAISKNQYSGGPSNPFCWLSDLEYQKYSFWTPLGIFLCLGGIFLILLIREIYVIVSSNQSKSDKSSRFKILKIEAKPMISLVMYFSILLYLFIYDQYIKNNMHIFTDSIPSYAQCLVTSEDATRCLLKAPNIAGFGYFIYCLRVFGIYAFIIYGVSKKILHIWKFNYLVLFVSRKIEQFTMASTTAKSSNSNQSSSNTINQNQSSSTIVVSNIETLQDGGDDEESHSNSHSVELDSED